MLFSFLVSNNEPVPSGNEGNIVASIPNNSEEPLPVELQSAPVIIQVSVTQCGVLTL